MKRALGVAVGAIAWASVAVAGEKTIEFGIHTPQEGATYEEILATWKKAEELGFHSAWLYDHFIPLFGSKERPVLEGWTTLTALGRDTEKIRIGILVTGNTYREPAVLAKMAATVDHLSNGRLEFGIGAAWEGYEHEAYGIDFHTAKERAERLEEALAVITKLWTEEKPSYDGEYYDLKEAEFQPKPLQQPHPPIVVGGKGKDWIMPTVGKYANEWNIAMGVTPEGVLERLAIIREACREAGRRTCVEEVSAFLPLVSITNIPFAGPATRLGARLVVEERVADSLLVGSAKQIRERLQEFVDAGATRIIVSIRHPFDHELMETFANEVMSEMR